MHTILLDIIVANEADEVGCTMMSLACPGIIRPIALRYFDRIVKYSS